MNHSTLQAPEAAREHLNEADVRKVLKALRPHAANAAPGDVNSLARVISIVWDVVGELPRVERRRIAGDKDTLRAALLQVWDDLRRARTHRVSTGAEPLRDRAIEHSLGTGLGERVSVAEGRARLDRYVTPRMLETWAGPTAGAGELTLDLGIPRSTLNSWRTRKAIVGLLRGERKLAYPLEQFVDSRPIQGISDVLRVIPDERAAWLWLRQPHAALQGKSPLETLKEGGREKVHRVAERDFL